MPKNKEWELSVFAPEIGATKTLLVAGDMMAAEVILKLSSALGPQDWSDFGLWWPERKMWLKRPRVTLNAYSVESDSKLHFTAQHKMLHVQLPDRTIVKMKVNLACDCFNAVEQVCKQVGIRRFEELSFMRCNNRGVDGNPAVAYFNTRKGSVNPFLEPLLIRDKLGANPGEPTCVRNEYQVNGQAIGTMVMSRDVPDGMLFSRYTTGSHDRAYLHGLWFDSSKSLFSQDVEEGDYIQLRFKYFTFLDLDPMIDVVRIAQIYEQARWAILSEEVDCTEEEAISFAALQLQTELVIQRKEDEGESGQANAESSDLESALTDLQVSLGTQTGGRQATSTPVRNIRGELKFSKIGRFTLKGPKTYYFVFQDTTLSQYKDSSMQGGLVARYNFSDGEVSMEVEPEKKKYAIRANVREGDEFTEIRLSVETEIDFTDWYAACRMTARGKPAGGAGHGMQRSAIQMVLDMHRPKKHRESAEAVAEHHLPHRILKKKPIKQVAPAILDAHASVSHLSLIDARLNYINSCEALLDFGISYFIVRFQMSRSSKDELLGVAYKGLIRLDPKTHAHLHTWRYSTMRSWNINWEIKEMRIEHEDETLTFTCSSADLKVLHEFIGGYIFMSMRKDVHEPVNTEMFYKLTGGWEG